MPFVERRITSRDGLSLYLRDYGEPLDPRPALLCLGGLTRNSKDFAAFAERFGGDGRRVLCPDYRGRGRSDHDPDWRNYDPRVYVRDVADILAALNVHRVAAVGTSLGGILAMALAAALPAALESAVLNDVGPEIEAGGLEAILRYIGEDKPRDGWDEAVAAIRTALPNLSFQDEDAWKRMARNTFREDEDGRLRFDWDVALAKPLRRGSRRIPDMWRLFRALGDRPLLVLRGEASDILSRGCLARMRAAKPGLAWREIPGCGHAPTLGEPEALEALDAFLGGG